MRFFQYKATDNAGRPAEGTIRAADAAAARDALTKAGYRVSHIGDVAAAQPASTPQKPAPAPIRTPAAVRTAAATAVAMRPVVAAPAPQVSTATPPTAVKTPFSSDKDLFFLFSQLAQYFRAGIAPQNAFHNLANQAKPKYVESLREIERTVTEGKTISAVLERYPYLYPPDVVGVVQAGEISGYLGEACDNIANQMEASSRIKRRLSFFIWLFAMLLASFPIVYSVVTGSIKSIAAQDQANGSLPVAQTLRDKVFEDLKHQIIPSLIIAGLAIAFMTIWHSMPLRRLRHRLILGTPVLAGRVKAEAMARFTWALSLIAKGGVSPQTTFAIAATCVPNLIIRDRLMASAQTMMESERLSSALRRSEVLPIEYTHIVETGELTGDVPRALSDINRATDADLKAREGTAVTMSSFLFYFALAAVALVMLAFLYRTYGMGLISTLTNDS